MDAPGDDGGGSAGPSVFRTNVPPKLLEAQSPPDAPGAITLTRADGTVTASWDAVTDATKYHVTYAIDDGWWNWTSAADSHNTASIDISGLDNSKPYIVGVRAGYDNNQWSAWTNSGSIAPLTPAGPPASVTAARSGTGISVSWSAPANNGGSAVTDYDVNYSANDGYSWTRVHTNLGAMTTSATIPNTDNAVDYIIAVRASNAIGGGEWLNSTPVASTLAAPALVKAYKADVKRSLDFIDVEWTAVSGATGYDINSILTIDGLSYHHSEATNVTGTSYRINDVMYYRPPQWVIAVRARNANGPAPWTNSAPAAANPTLSASSVTATTATLTLSPYNGTWHYKADAAPHNTCQGPVSTKTKDLTGLTTGQTYTYVAYSDSVCSEGKKLDAASAFTTLTDSGIVLTPATGVSVP